MKTFVIDAGHHTNTPGKRSPDGFREFTFNQRVAVKVKKLLSKYEDAKVIYTHSATEDVPLNKRVALANKAKATAFVSIHANAFGSGGYNDACGIETFVGKNASQKSKELAMTVNTNIVKATGLKNRGTKVGDFAVVRDTHMPAILVEGGFMTNVKELALLKTDSYQSKVANAIVDGLADEFKLIKKKGNVVYKIAVDSITVGTFADVKNINIAVEGAIRTGAKDIRIVQI